MNKKVLSIILGIVVLFIWVKVFSKIFDQFSDDEYATVEAPSMNVVDLSKYIKRDSLPALNLNYRDPFLGKSYHNTNKSSSHNDNSTSSNVKRVTVEKKEVKITKWRSEEHTSELQSRPHLVCSLLLEKKKLCIFIT